MMNKELVRKFKQERSKMRVRKRVVGVPDKPRLCVYRSLSHIYAQLIDDVSGRTLVSCSSIDKDVREQVKKVVKKTDRSLLVGENIARKALAAGIENVVFDRSRYQYHGRVKAVADGARKAGLKF